MKTHLQSVRFPNDSSGSGGEYTSQEQFWNTLVHAQRDSSPSLPSPDHLLSQALSPYGYYHLPMIPGSVYGGLSQWNGDPEGPGQGEYELQEEGYASDGSYFRHYVNHVTGDWYTSYYSGDAERWGSYLRTESGSQSSHPLWGLYGPSQWINDDLSIPDPDRPQPIPLGGVALLRG